MKNRRILLIDDTKSIHEDFTKILAPSAGKTSALDSARAAFFGGEEASEEPEKTDERASYELQSAFQGEEALELVKSARDKNEPFAVAFVDVRMPPGWDGVQTIQQLWKIDPELHCVICTAYSDYSWDETFSLLGKTDRLLILKKPFDPAEIRQVASAFTAKWEAAAEVRQAMEVIRQKEIESRAYASSLETLNKALATSKASADRMSLIKSEFMLSLTSQVSEHLNAILDRLIEDGRTEGLDDALDRSQRLLETIDKVTDFTNVEAGRMVLRSDECSISDIFSDLATTYGQSAERKGLKLEFDVHDTVPSRIRTDEARLAQVLGNLVENAIRFTDEGAVRISVATEPNESWERANLRIDVTDTGCGLVTGHSTQVFEPFNAWVGMDEPPETGGLGLAVSKQITRRMGGDLTCSSEPGVGSTFTVRLQVKRGE